jgi:uncharacterized protein
MRRLLTLGVIVIFLLVFSQAWAQKTVRLSIATGGAGSVYYPLGQGMAGVISKYIPYAEAAAEVTTASVDNCRLVGAGKADLALVTADTAWNAQRGKAPFKEGVPMRTVAALYPSNTHLVTVEGKGIDKVTDLKGKKVSTGAPRSGTEAMALRVLEASGLDPNKDIVRERFGSSESAGALREKKIDAYFWVGGLPTASVTELGMTSGLKFKLIGHADVIPKMREKYGPFYVEGVIPAKTYPGQDAAVSIVVAWNLFVCHEKMKEAVVYDIVKTLFDHTSELKASSMEARSISLQAQGAGASPLPFHPGAIRYFSEKGLKVN